MAGTEMMEMLRRSGGLEAISRETGVSPATAAAGAEALLPAVVGGFRNTAGKSGGGREGLGYLVSVLGALGGGGLAANVLGPDPTDVARGNSVLEEIFGGKDISTAVAAHAAERSGIEPETLEKMLPILAMLVGGYMAARAQTISSEGGGLLDNLGVLLNSFLADKDGQAPAEGNGTLDKVMGYQSGSDVLAAIIDSVRSGR